MEVKDSSCRSWVAFSEIGVLDSWRSGSGRPMRFVLHVLAAELV